MLSVREVIDERDIKLVIDSEDAEGNRHIEVSLLAAIDTKNCENPKGDSLSSSMQTYSKVQISRGSHF